MMFAHFDEIICTFCYDFFFFLNHCYLLCLFHPELSESKYLKKCVHVQNEGHLIISNLTFACTTITLVSLLLPT